MVLGNDVIQRRDRRLRTVRSPGRRCTARFLTVFMTVSAVGCTFLDPLDDLNRGRIANGTGSCPEPPSLELTPGWNVIPQTLLQTVCPPDTPDYDFSTACRHILDGAPAAVADTCRNRLVVWGGAYEGNEVYALDIGHGALAR